MLDPERIRVGGEGRGESLRAGSLSDERKEVGADDGRGRGLAAEVGIAEAADGRRCRVDGDGGSLLDAEERAVVAAGVGPQVDAA